MKKTILTTAILIALFISCKKENNQELTPTETDATVATETISQECYLGINNKDTIVLSYNIKGNQITQGKLSFNYFEKDRNEGTIAGGIKGDTLFADYTFMSEGMVSVRQVAFLKRDGNLIEGYGDIIDNNGKVSFKSTKDLKFEGKPQLSKVDCKK